jgi:hypothetical protein
LGFREGIESIRMKAKEKYNRENVRHAIIDEEWHIGKERRYKKAKAKTPVHRMKAKPNWGYTQKANKR